MIPHLKVQRADAETARAQLEREGLLHPDFRAQHDGDFVLWSGSPIELTSRLEEVWVDGQRVHGGDDE